MDARDHEGRTPLAVAAEHRSLRVARKLVELGANCHTTDLAGRSILNTAVRVAENEAMIALMLGDPQTDVNLTDNDGRGLHSSSYQLRLSCLGQEAVSCPVCGEL